MGYLQVSTMSEEDLRQQFLRIKSDLEDEEIRCRGDHPNWAGCDYIGDDAVQEMIAIDEELKSRGLDPMPKWIEDNGEE